MSKQIQLKTRVLSENDRQASLLKKRFDDAGVYVLNLISSPGSGKTTLLERTLEHQSGEWSMAVIVGDVQTENDADRLKAAGGGVVNPIVTGGACHLDAAMIERSLDGIDLEQIDLLVIENVGNLVCPAGYNLGEDAKVVLISTTEGDDKPLKYPAIFRRASMMVINKADLLGMSDFSEERVIENARSLNGNIDRCSLSCRTGTGLQSWYDWLNNMVAGKKRLSRVGAEERV